MGGHLKQKTKPAAQRVLAEVGCTGLEGTSCLRLGSCQHLRLIMQSASTNVCLDWRQCTCDGLCGSRIGAQSRLLHSNMSLSPAGLRLVLVSVQDNKPLPKLLI